jgi:hypothetical protein
MTRRRGVYNEIPDTTQSVRNLCSKLAANGSARNRKKGLEPELRVIDIETKEEISADTLSVNRFEGLSAHRS